MLVITRKVGESFSIGDDVIVTILEINDDREIRVGIKAPRHIQIKRDNARKGA